MSNKKKQVKKTQISQLSSVQIQKRVKSSFSLPNISDKPDWKEVKATDFPNVDWIITYPAIYCIQVHRKSKVLVSIECTEGQKRSGRAAVAETR